MSVIEKYIALSPNAVPVKSTLAFVVDRIVFDPKHRKSPHRRYQILDMQENVIGYARSLGAARDMNMQHTLTLLGLQEVAKAA